MSIALANSILRQYDTADYILIYLLTLQKLYKKKKKKCKHTLSIKLSHNPMHHYQFAIAEKAIFCIIYDSVNSPSVGEIYPR